MFRAFQILTHLPFAEEILRPVTRSLFGWLIAPVSRVIRVVPGLRRLDGETIQDIHQWMRGSVLLFFATKNVESLLFGDALQHISEEHRVLTLIPRFLLALSVIETMPDQDVFGLIHNRMGLGIDRKSEWLPQFKMCFKPMLKKLLCQHLNRSSCVFAIIATIAPGWIGWTAFGLAVSQYLIIGLITTRDEARSALDRFDEMVARRRTEFMSEFEIVDRRSTEEE